MPHVNTENPPYITVKEIKNKFRVIIIAWNDIGGDYCVHMIFPTKHKTPEKARAEAEYRAKIYSPPLEVR